MIEWLALVGIVVFFAACGTTPPPCQGASPYTEGACVPLADQSLLAQITSFAQAAHDYYGTQMPMPTLVVYEKGDCDAIFSQGGKTVVVHQGTLTLPDGSCDYGTYYPDANAVYMVTTGDWKWTLAHEMLHQALRDRYGDSDHAHQRPEWKTWLPACYQMLNEKWG